MSFHIQVLLFAVNSAHEALKYKCRHNFNLFFKMVSIKIEVSTAALF